MRMVPTNVRKLHNRDFYLNVFVQVMKVMYVIEVTYHKEDIPMLLWFEKKNKKMIVVKTMVYLQKTGVVV